MTLPKLNLKIEKLTSEGRGLARHDGRIIFVPWVLPGETVLVQIEKEHKDYAEASLVEIIEKSPHRIEPKCSYFYSCGGCQFQNLDYASQLLAKKEIVLDALKRISRLSNPPIADVLPSQQQWNYRSRIQVHKNKKGEWGFYKPLSHEVVKIDCCAIADEQLNESLKQLNLEVHQAKTMELSLHPVRGFAQSNASQNIVLVEEVLKAMSPRESDLIIECYSGAGNFTIPLAKKSKKIWAIEKDRDLVDYGRKQAPQNIQWMNLSVVSGLKRLHQNHTKPSHFLVNPPRTGLGDVAKLLPDFEASKIIYVSCNPATFARDISVLIKAGYQLESCQPVDMFPQTSHVEVVGTLSKKD